MKKIHTIPRGNIIVCVFKLHFLKSAKKGKNEIWPLVNSYPKRIMDEKK